VLSDALSFGVSEGESVDLSADVPPNVSILWMTGTGDPGLTPAQAGQTQEVSPGRRDAVRRCRYRLKAFSEAVESALKSALPPRTRTCPRRTAC